MSPSALRRQVGRLLIAGALLAWLTLAFTGNAGAGTPSPVPSPDPKDAKAEAAKTQPTDAAADQWKKRMEFARDVQTFAEYSLSTTAVIAPPAKTVELVDALI